MQQVRAFGPDSRRGKARGGCSRGGGREGGHYQNGTELRRINATSESSSSKETKTPGVESEFDIVPFTQFCHFCHMDGKIVMCFCHLLENLPHVVHSASLPCIATSVTLNRSGVELCPVFTK